ncbi:hypothetical protein AAMO2058_000922400 [Amorphochlora amoebiformis]
MMRAISKKIDDAQKVEQFSEILSAKAHSHRYVIGKKRPHGHNPHSHNPHGHSPHGHKPHGHIPHSHIHTLHPTLTPSEELTIKPSKYPTRMPTILPSPSNLPPSPSSPWSWGSGSLGPASLGPASLGPASLGPASLGPASLGPASLGPASLGPVSLGPASLGPASLGPSLGPSSLGPASLGPASLGPASLGPASLGPASLIPASLAPASLVPVSLGPASLGPASFGPASFGPASLGPLSLAPMSLAPTTLGPLTRSPSTLIPSTLTPSSLSPTSRSPISRSPMTSKPSTLSPATSDPTTVPTSGHPTSMHPTTHEPTTCHPTSGHPTSMHPTSPNPTSKSPSTCSPASVSPSSISPSSLSPSTFSPSTGNPTSVTPSSCGPSTWSPSSQNPTTRNPSTSNPSQTPSSQNPSQTPSSQTPTTNVPTSGHPTSGHPTSSNPTSLSPTSRSPISCHPTNSPETQVPTAPGETFSPSSAPSPSPPLPIYARFSPNAVRVLVDFSRDCNLAKAECSQLVSNRTLTLLGLGSRCFWTGSRTLAIRLGYGFLLEPGNILEVKGGTIFDSTGVSSSSVVTSTFVAASPLVIHPQVVISGRSVFSFCEKVTLTSTSSSGSLGKPYLAYNWTLVSATPNNTASAESVLNISTPTLSLSFYPGKYTVRLNLTNWMGASSFGEYSFVVSPDISPVITSSYPLTFNVSRSDSLIISSDSRIPSCGNSTLTGLDGDFVRRSKWTQLIPNTTEATAAAEAAGSSRAAGFMRLTSHRVTIQGANSATLQVNSGQMKMGMTYGFHLQVFNIYRGSNVGNSKETFLVSVKTEPVIAQIRGGDDRLLPIGSLTESKILIDASLSTDPANSTAKLNYNWLLSLSSGPTINTSSLQSLATEQMFFTTVPFLYLNKSSLISDSVYHLFLNVTSRRRGGKAVSSTSQVLRTTSTAVPVVSVLGGGIVNEAIPITLTLSTSSPSPTATYLWECTSQNLILTDPTTRSTSLDSQNLQILPSVLNGGATYTFQASVTIGGATGSASTTVIVNAGPVSGSCGGSPEVGEGLKTYFLLGCTGWSDQDTPMLFKFSTFSPTSTLELSSYSQLSSITTLLPARPSNTTIISSIQDSLGATSSFMFSLQVSQPDTFDVQDTRDLIKIRLTEGDSSLASVLISGTASYVFSNRSIQNTSQQASTVSGLVSLVDSLLNSSVSTTEAQVSTPLSLLQTVTSGPVSSLTTSTQGAVLSIVERTINSSLNSFSNAVASSTLGVLGNVLVASSGRGGSNSSQGGTGKRIENVLQKVARGVLSSQVPDASPVSISSGGISLTTQIRDSTTVLGSSTSSSSGAGVTISPSLVLPGNGSIGILISTAGNLYPSNTNDTDTVLVDLFQSGLQLKPSNLSIPFQIAIPAPELPPDLEYICRFWDASEGRWSTRGVTRGDGTTLSCESTHLSAFSAEPALKVQVNTFGKDDIKEEAFSFRNPIMVLVCTMLTMYFILGFIFIRCYGYSTRNQDVIQQECKFWRKINNTSMLLTSGSRSMSNFSRMAYWKLRRGHIWLGILIRHPGDFLSSFKRVTILFTLLFNSTTVGILLYDQSIQFGFIGGNLAVSIFSMMLAYPLPFLASYLYRRSPPEEFLVNFKNERGIMTCLPMVLALVADADVSGNEAQAEIEADGDDDVNGDGAEAKASTRPEAKQDDAILADFAIPAAIAAGACATEKKTSARIFGLVDRHDKNAMNHMFTYQDLLATTGCILTMCGCSLILTVLSVKLGVDSFDGVVTVLMSFGQDFVSRLVLITIIQYLVFGPTCWTLYRYFFSAEQKDGPKPITSRTVWFYSGKIGFRFKKKTIVKIEENTQSSGKLEFGWKIFSVHGDRVKENATDSDIAKSLQHVQRIQERFYIIFDIAADNLEVLQSAREHTQNKLKFQLVSLKTAGGAEENLGSIRGIDAIDSIRESSPRSKLSISNTSRRRSSLEIHDVISASSASSPRHNSALRIRIRRRNRRANRSIGSAHVETARSPRAISGDMQESGRKRAESFVTDTSFYDDRGVNIIGLDSLRSGRRAPPSPFSKPQDSNRVKRGWSNMSSLVDEKSDAGSHRVPQSDSKRSMFDDDGERARSVALVSKRYTFDAQYTFDDAEREARNSSHLGMGTFLCSENLSKAKGRGRGLI